MAAVSQEPAGRPHQGAWLQDMLEDRNVADEPELEAPCLRGIQPAHGHVETELFSSHADCVRRRIDSEWPLEARISQGKEKASGGSADIQYRHGAIDHMRRYECGLIRIPLKVPGRESRSFAAQVVLRRIRVVLGKALWIG